MALESGYYGFAQGPEGSCIVQGVIVRLVFLIDFNVRNGQKIVNNIFGSWVVETWVNGAAHKGEDQAMPSILVGGIWV